MIQQVITSTRFALLSFRRNPAATFFTLVFPLMFMLLFGYIFGSGITDSGVKVATFIVPGILVMSIVSATFVNLAMTTVFAREKGQLKRIKGTPLPPVVWIVAQILASFVIVVVMTVLLIAMGRVLFDVTFNFSTLGVFLVSVLLGTAAFSALGLALTSIIPNASAASAMTNLIVLPLYFVSEVFFFGEDLPAFIETVGTIFPVKHLVQSLQDSFDPGLTSVDVPWTNWLVIAAWGAAGVVIAARRFRWTPA